MHINLRGEKLAITFDYDPLIVDVIRTVPGRRWNSHNMRWEVPIQNAPECVEILKPLGFLVHADVLALVDLKQKEEAAVREIKSSPAFYDGRLPLYNFQKIGAAFLKRLDSALLADAPGLGKTIQTIAALENNQNILVFCPASLKYSWKEEIEKWEPGALISVIDGSPLSRRIGWESGAKWKIANYELLLHDFDLIQKHISDHGPWQAIIADEASRVANPLSKTTRSLKAIRTVKKIALTGAPVSNSPEDIFSVVDWLYPRSLGTHYQFRSKYLITDDFFHSKILGYKNLDDLARRLEPVMLRRAKEEVFDDFPKKTFENVLFDLSENERDFYAEIKKGILKEIEKLTINPHTLNLITVKMLRLKQATDDPALLGSKIISSKFGVLAELLETIVASGGKALIFTQFAEMAKILYEKLSRYAPLLIYGEISPQERQNAVNDFRDDPARKLFISTEAGAFGLNLEAASYVFHYDMPWSVSKLTQREDRAHRIGQTRPVTVYNIAARSTIDEYVAKVLHKKQKASVNILQDLERLEKAGLSEIDIKAILRL